MSYLFPALPPVRGLSLYSSKARSVTLKWLQPNTICSITHYFISYSGAPMWNGPHMDSLDTKIGQVNDSVTYDLRDLQPYTNYSIQVLPATEAANGTLATLHFTTREASRWM